MKAVFVAPNLAVGGAERQWSLLLPGLARRGIDTEVFTLDDHGTFFDELVEEGIRGECLHVKGRVPFRAAWQAAAAIAARQPDIIVTTGSSAHVVGHLGSRRPRALHVAAIHSSAELPEPTRRRALVRLVAPRVDACTAVTRAQLPFLTSLGFDQSSIHFIPNGVDTPNPERSRDEIRTAIGVTGTEFVALLVATLRPEKRVDRFVASIVRARALGADIKGLVAGDGPESASLRELCTATDGIVTALGYREDVADLMYAADVVCLTSDAEALPVTLLEAMALGRPVVTTDVGGVRDAIVDGETGLVLTPDDLNGLASAIARLAEDRTLGVSLGKAGRDRHRATFTVERMVESHATLFEHLLDAAEAPVPERRMERAL